MTPERWNKIKALFSSAQDCPKAERVEFLRRACQGDEELKKEIEKLLDSYNEDDAFLQNSAVAEAVSMFEGEVTAGIIHTTADDSPQRFDGGTVLNERYEIARLIGRGGMGEVYLAHDNRINRNVAIKVIHSDLASNKESLRRFALEAQAVSALNHPHIMTIHEFDHTDDGTLFFVAEFVDGDSLKQLIGADLDLHKAIDIAVQVTSALSAAHEAAITHRDLKPENIMVRRDGYVKVLDFGLAKLAQRRTPSLRSGSEDPTIALIKTRPGVVVGTAGYMSPEQARARQVDARTDIWSLGVVLYEMLTGHRPFSGETHADIIVSVLKSEPPRLSSYVSDLPDELELIVTKALSKDVERRYQTAKELGADLERVRKDVELGLRPGRSAHQDSLDNRVADDRVADEQRPGESAIPTADERTRPTSGGRNKAAELQPFWSKPSFASAIHQAKAHKVVSSSVAFIVLALVSTAAYFGFLSSGSEEIDSIAVLPFENVGGNGEMAYAADGLSEALIDRLSQLPQLKVISRNSSFKFRGADIDVQDVASQLGARVVVTGKVEKIGDELLIRIDVVDAVENRQLTGGQYRRKASELEKLRNEIARATAEQLNVRLTEAQTVRLVYRSTENSESYRYYLNGVLALAEGTPESYDRALSFFEKAIELDPEFALPYAEIAWVYCLKGIADDDPEKSMAKAKAAIEKALALDNESAKAHAVLARIYEYDFDWREAEREHKRAIELSPNMDFIRNNYAFFLSVLDRQDEALAQLEEQRSRDPLNQRMHFLQKGIVLIQARRFDEALQAYSDAQAVEPSKEIFPFTLGYAYAGKGHYDEAITYYKKAVVDHGGEEKYSQPLVYLAATYAKLPEKRAEARVILARIERMPEYVSPALLAAIYAELGENDKAMELLERAFIKRDLLLRFIKTGYEYDSLRNDARFVDLTKRIGLLH